jgi:undecaprenyl-diphosphatase
VTINLLIEKQHDFSFPSGHTIASFEACTVMMLGNKKLGIPATLLAIAIAFSRLYLYVHYPTDVIASVILGTIFGIIGYAIAKKLPMKKGKYEKVY